MFDIERQLRGKQGMVASQAQELTAEQKQRDVYETHRHRVFSVCYYMTANELEAEDILTRTFIQVFANAPEPKGQQIDQALLDELEQRFSLAPSAPAQPDRQASLDRRRVRKTDLEESVATLPPRERLIFLLRDVEGYPAGKIAELLGSEELEIQRTLISARIRMRNALHALHAEEVARESTHLEDQSLPDYAGRT